MNKRQEDLLKFAQSHPLRIANKYNYSGVIMYCSGIACIDCVLKPACSPTSSEGEIKHCEVEELKVTYPEYFI